jgi:hypothetical protein
MKNLKSSIATTLVLLVSFANAQDTEKRTHDHSKMEMDGMKMDGMQIVPEFSNENLANAY